MAIEFARRGLEGATTDRIAERAGVSQPYVVRLFGTKKALFLAVANRAFERIAERFRGAAVGEGPEQRLEHMGAAYIGLLGDRDELALQLQLYAGAHDPEIRACVATRFAQLHELVAELSGAEPEQLKRSSRRGCSATSRRRSTCCRSHGTRTGRASAWPRSQRPPRRSASRPEQRPGERREARAWPVAIVGR